jgi:hypothetical protein
VRRAPAWLRWLLVAGIAWAQAGLGLSLLRDLSARNLTLVISMEASGACTLLLYLARRLWLPWLSRRPLAGATVIGVFNAALVEALFLAVQTVLGADGVAADRNLLMDWLLTMPWYAGMVWIFVRVQRRQRFSLPAVLLWGAAYEAGADGIVGGLVVPAVLGTAPNPLLHLAFLGGLAFWQFIPVYSSLVLAPALVLDAAPGTSPDMPSPGPARFAAGLKPLLWLPPYTAYLLLVLVVLGLARAR